MVNTGIRVVLASDQPEMRRNLARIVQDRLGGVVVGEGENAVRALRLARRLRPDMAIIDSYLPHNIGLGNVPLSHSAGLDAAQAISAEIPNVRVVLVDSARAASLYPGDVDGILLSSSAIAAGRNMAFAWPQASLTFASLQAQPVPRHRPVFSDVCITIGTCGLLFGLVLTATMFLAYIGLPLLAIGGVSLFAGCIGKLFSPLRSGESDINEGPISHATGPGELGEGEHDQ